MNNQRYINDMLIRLVQLEHTTATIAAKQDLFSPEHQDIAISSLTAEHDRIRRMLESEFGVIADGFNPYYGNRS